VFFNKVGRMDQGPYKGKVKHEEVYTTWKPLHVGTKPKNWPSLVMECAVSQSTSTMIAADYMLLMNSGRQVKNDIGIGVVRLESEIHIEL